MSATASSRDVRYRISRMLSTRSRTTRGRPSLVLRSLLTHLLKVVRSSTASSLTIVPRALTRPGQRSSRVRKLPILRSGVSVRTGKASRSLSRIPISATRTSSFAFSPCTAILLSVKARSRTCLPSTPSSRMTSFLNSAVPGSSPMSSSRTTPLTSLSR